MATVNRKEATELLEEGYDIYLETDKKDYHVYQVSMNGYGQSDDWYQSDVLGEKSYDDAETILKESIEKLEDRGEYVTIDY